MKLEDVYIGMKVTLSKDLYNRSGTNLIFPKGTNGIVCNINKEIGVSFDGDVRCCVIEDLFMSELVSGKEAKLAWANGEDVEFYSEDFNEWFLVDGTTFTNVFDKRKCRIKPKTITINGAELSEPLLIQSIGQLDILLQFDSESKRNVFKNTLLNRNF